MQHSSIGYRPIFIKLIFQIQILFLTCSCVWGQVPDYYRNIDFTLVGKELKEELATLIVISHSDYVTFTPGVWEALKLTDLDEGSMDHVTLIYGFDDDDNIIITDRTRHVDLSCHISNCSGLWTREHVYPRSLGTPALSNEGAGADLHAIRAIDSDRNNLRANRAFGNASGKSRILPDGAFYPGDEWKGDVARMMMYMHLRYPSQCPAERVGTGSSDYSEFDNIPDIFLIWNAEDPPSMYEMHRNDQFELLQGNRNPFIDNPYLATKIWNGPPAEDTWQLSRTIDEFYDFKVYPTVTSDVIFIEAKPDFSWQVITSLGQILKSGAHYEQPDFSMFASGWYYLNISHDNGNEIFKILKQ
jgi:endonuclease I